VDLVCLVLVLRSGRGRDMASSEWGMHGLTLVFPVRSMGLTYPLECILVGVS
jgi:hypothetical protein